MEAKTKHIVLILSIILTLCDKTQAQHFGISNASNQARISINDQLLISEEIISENERKANEVISTEMEAYQWPMHGFITFKASSIELEHMKLTTIDEKGEPVNLVSKSSGKKMTIEVASLDEGSYYFLMEDPINRTIAKFKFRKKG